MKLTKANLKLISIHNPHNFCTVGGGRIYVGYTPQETGRASRSANWKVVGVREQTDLKAHWTDHGCKTFNVFSFGHGTHHEKKEALRVEAIAWATEHYGIDDWVRDPFGDYQERAVWERVAENLKEVGEQGVTNGSKEEAEKPGPDAG